MDQLEDDGYFNLGTYHRSVTTKNPLAQRWFDRGLIWAYGFNMNEACECFEKVILADPNCAMGYWGVAFTRGPNYNQEWALFDPIEREEALTATYNASQKALELAHNASPVEQALIQAISQRYPQETPPRDFKKWDQSYARAMEGVYKRFGDDIDVATLYADALINLTPWELWDPYTGQPAPNARVLDAVDAVERAFKLPNADKHPGLLHLHIHIMEMSHNPEAAVPSADRLRHLVPDSGHLNHMPSHIDVLVGDYRSAVTANANGIRADNMYIEKAGRMSMYAFYVVHNYLSLIYAGMLAGQLQVCLDNCALLEEFVTEELIAMRSPPMADWLESSLGTRAHVLVRFGRWDEILDLPLPKDQAVYCVTTATMHYAKGIAWASKGKIKAAESEKKLFTKALKRVLPSRMEFPNKCVNILKIADEMLTGELEYRRGNYEIAFEHLRKSIELDDGLIYSEPWSWMMPTRHAYAALLLEQGQVEKAAKAYAEDLGLVKTLPRGHQHPNNVWALHGYHECLTLLGRTDEAAFLELPIKLADAIADVPVRSSCYCRRTGGDVCMKGQR